MELTEEQYEQIVSLFPVQMGNMRVPNLQVLNAIPYVAEHSYKWRGLPSQFRRCHTIYSRMNRWSKSGVIKRVFEGIQKKQLIQIKPEVMSMDSTIVKVHPDGTGARKENGPQAIGKSRGGWTTGIHLIAADVQTAVTFPLSPGQARDVPEGRRLLHRPGGRQGKSYLLMDRAYEGNGTRQLALDLGFEPVVPPRGNRVDPWEYDREMYKRRNEVERLFRRLKGFRRIFSRFEKLDVMFLGFILFVLIFDALRSMNTP